MVRTTAMRFVGHTLLMTTAICAIALAAAIRWGTPQAVLSIAAGAGIAMASFAVLAAVLLRAIKGGRGGVAIAFLGMFKMAIIGMVLWWLLRKGIVEPLAFLGGFSTMVAALIVEGLRGR